MEIAIAAPEAIQRLERRLVAEVTIAAEDWSRFVSDLARWEDEHLLDKPTTETLTDHKATVERLMVLGRIFAQVTENAELPDRQTSEMIAATQAVLEDKLKLWHRPRMNPAESLRILAECFPDEPGA